MNKPAADVMVEAADCSLFKQAASFHEEIIRSAGDAILGEDLSGKIVLWNGGAERLYGYSQVEAVGLSRITLVPPDKREGEASVRARIAQGERVASYETVRRRKDGSLVEVSITVSPIRNSIGRLVGLSWIARDITERRRTEDQQQLLISEMSHRVKNLFSIAQSLVHLSARSAETPKALADDVSCRFAALARAHALTAPLTNDPGAEQIVMLRELIDAIVAPYVGGAHRLRSRIVINHGALPVGGTAVTSFALLLHEFATNAAKYGALSTPDGRLLVSAAKSAEVLALTWTELGGPAITGPDKDEGFGARLAASIVRGQLGGEMFRDWKPEGLTIRVIVPVDRLGSPRPGSQAFGRK